jgi:enoyl-CoA hydratase/carnithine racemase
LADHGVWYGSDLIVASPTASFGLPEATVGLYAAAGGLPRLVHNTSLQIASEIAMTGRRLTAQEALDLTVAVTGVQ